MNKIMKEYGSLLQDWWLKREPREKQWLQVGSIIGFIFIVYIALLKPLTNSVDNARQRILVQEKTLAWMRSADKAIKKLEKNDRKNISHSPVVIINALQKAMEVTGLEKNASALKQSANDMIQIHFQNVNFDHLMTFLIDALKKQPLALLQFSAAATANPGQVNAEVQLKVE